MLAVVEIGGKQYQVLPGQVLEVANLSGKAGDKVVFDRVLLLSQNGKTQVGTPTVKGVKVTAKILSHLKGDKVAVRRFRAKSRYRRRRGFRPRLTRVEIVSVGRA